MTIISALVVISYVLFGIGLLCGLREEFERGTEGCLRATKFIVAVLLIVLWPFSAGFLFGSWAHLWQPNGPKKDD